MENVDLSKLGAFGKAIENFNYEEYKAMIIKNKQEDYSSKVKSGTVPELSAGEAEIYLNPEKYPDLVDFLVKERLRHQIDEILFQIYALNGDYRTPIISGPNAAVGIQKKFKTAYIPKFGTLDKKMTDEELAQSLEYGGVVGANISYVAFDDMRRVLYEKAGIPFTPISEIREIGKEVEKSEYSTDDRNMFIALCKVNNLDYISMQKESISRLVFYVPAGSESKDVDQVRERYEKFARIERNAATIKQKCTNGMKAEAMISQMENQAAVDSPKMMGFTVPWVLGLVTGVVVAAIVILGIVLIK